MKIFRFFNKEMQGADVAVSLSEPMVVTIPDTALLIQKHPFFIPDFTECCQAQFCMVVRICRLGRSIHQRFAHRYYDKHQTTVGVHFVASDVLKTLRDSHSSWDIAVGFDNAVVVAEHAVRAVEAGVQATLSLNEADYSTVVSASCFDSVDAQIARISQFYTLRQGDLLLFPLQVPMQQVQIDDRIILKVSDIEQLAFNVK